MHKLEEQIIQSFFKTKQVMQKPNYGNQGLIILIESLKYFYDILVKSTQTQISVFGQNLKLISKFAFVQILLTLALNQNFTQSTHLLIYHCHKAVLLHKWPLLQVCYRSWKNVAKHAHLVYLCLSQGSNPESLLKKNSQLTKLFNVC